MDRSPYDQGHHGLPTSQPYPPVPDQTPTTHGGPASNPYPQYSYDIHMRYSEDPNRPYPQDPNSHPPQDVPRQYTSMTSPYARDTSKEGPTSPYPKEILSPYTRDAPTSPYSKDMVSSYAREIPTSPYPREMPSGPYPPISTHYSPAPQQGQGHGQPVQLPPMAMSMQGPPHDYGAPQQMVMDTTGQIAPGGMKPRVTATLWEDEGTLCFQVDVKGTCVARREDNHMVNGTKLLNVAGMTRGRRDGILKAEKQKHVVKIGPMHLKGVWIPYERALTFANKENITHLLYPLFVHNIGALLYHPINHGRGGPSYPTAHHPRPHDESSHPPQQQQQQQAQQQHQHQHQQQHHQQHQQHQQQQLQSPPMQQEAAVFNTARER